MPLIELVDVRKDFSVYRSLGMLRRERTMVHAVKDLSFTVERGAILGYIGPNGAGKSTTVKMLTGILVPTAGRISVAGLTPSRDRITLAVNEERKRCAELMRCKTRAGRRRARLG